MKLTNTFLAALGIATIATTAHAAVTYATSGSTYTENFDSGLPSGAATLTWTDDSTFAGTYAYRFGGTDPAGAVVEYRRTSGNSTGIELFQWRDSASASDGALGTKPTDATGSIATGIQFTNNTGITLTEFTLGYTGEQWVNSNSGQNNQLIFAYQLGSPANLAAGTWTDVAALQFDSPIDGDGVSASENIDGNAAANRTVIAPVTVSGLSWADGTDLYVRWFDSNSVGVDQGLAIDDVSFSAVPEPSTSLLVFGGGIALVSLRRRTARA